MRRARSLVQIGVIVSLLIIPGAAHAASIVAPADGDVVASRPVFTFDFAKGAADVELSRSPDLRTVGDSAGMFVDQDAQDYFLLSRGAQQPLDQRLLSGRWYWHGRVRDDTINDAGDFGPWAPVRSFEVDDETPTIEGWRVRADRLRARRGCSRVRVRGRVAYSDNDPAPRPTIALAGSIEKEWADRSGSGDFDRTICTRARRLRLAVIVEDRTGQYATSDIRMVTVGRP